MNPFGSALLAYHQGDLCSSFRLERDDGFIEEVPASVFFETQAYPMRERIAFERCKALGQQSFAMSYGDEKATFEWLHIDFASLQAHCDNTGWKARSLMVTIFVN